MIFVFLVRMFQMNFGDVKNRNLFLDSNKQFTFGRIHTTYQHKKIKASNKTYFNEHSCKRDANVAKLPS